MATPVEDSAKGRRKRLPPGRQRRVGGRGRATAYRSSAIGTVSAGAALAEAVAVAVHLEDIDVMGETVEQCPGQALGAEGLGPFVERVLDHPDRPEDGRHSKANCTSSGFKPHSTGWEGSIWGIPD